MKRTERLERNESIRAAVLAALMHHKPDYRSPTKLDEAAKIIADFVILVDARWLYDLLKDGRPHRKVYRGKNGWFVTYGGGEVSSDAVRELVERDLIHSVYNSCPEDCYHIGLTLDVDATMAERKKHRRGKDAPKIYCPPAMPTVGK
jgi:hypothetical protein